MFKFFTAPPDGATIEYKILNHEFSYFLRMYYCDFLYRELCSVFCQRTVFSDGKE